jgi:hypothetical protein
MAANVTSIIIQIKAITAAKLGAGWAEMPFVTDLAKNDERRARKSYGVRPLPAASTQTVTNSYALDHVFELVLMQAIVKQDDDSEAMATIGDLYDQHDEVFRQLARAKVNLPGLVLLVSEPALPEPEFIGGRQFVALRQQFNVRYRQAI